MGGFLAQTEQDVRGVFDDSVISGWNFAHESIQGFLEAPYVSSGTLRCKLIRSVVKQKALLLAEL